MLIADINRLLSVNIYIYSQLPTGRTRKGPGKRVRLIEMSELSEIQNIMQIN